VLASFHASRNDFPRRTPDAASQTFVGEIDTSDDKRRRYPQATHLGIAAGQPKTQLRKRQSQKRIPLMHEIVPPETLGNARLKDSCLSTSEGSRANARATSRCIISFAASFTTS
jgi:hypothetical protein